MSDQNTLKSKKDQVHELREKGYVIVKGLVPKERRDAMREVARLQLAEAAAPVEFEADLKYPGAPDSKEAPGGHTVRRLLDAYARHPFLAEFATSPKCAAGWSCISAKRRICRARITTA